MKLAKNSILLNFQVKQFAKTTILLYYRTVLNKNVPSVLSPHPPLQHSPPGDCSTPDRVYWKAARSGPETLNNAQPRLLEHCYRNTSCTTVGGRKQGEDEGALQLADQGGKEGRGLSGLFPLSETWAATNRGGGYYTVQHLFYFAIKKCYLNSHIVFVLTPYSSTWYRNTSYMETSAPLTVFTTVKTMLRFAKHWRGRLQATSGSVLRSKTEIHLCWFTASSVLHFQTFHSPFLYIT